jgi:hypothetical protein
MYGLCLSVINPPARAGANLKHPIPPKGIPSAMHSISCAPYFRRTRESL